MTFAWATIKSDVVIEIGTKEQKMELSENPCVVAAANAQEVQVLQNRIRSVLVIGEPDTVPESQKFYSRLSDLTFVGPDRLYVVDNEASCIRVFDTNSGKESFKFGSKGRGPGEFLLLSRIKNVPGKGILVIDNTLQRVTVFDYTGKFVETIPLRERIDDITFLNDSLALTSRYAYKPDYRPLRILSLRSQTTVREFGSVIETQKDIFESVQKAVVQRAGSYDMLPGNTSVFYLPDVKQVYFSQRNPYRLVRYHLQNEQEKVFHKPVEFSTESNYGITARSGGGSISVTTSFGQSGGEVAFCRYGDLLLAVVVSADLETNYLDCYDLSGTFKRRLQIPSITKNRRTACKFAAIGDGPSIYFLLYDFRDLISWVEKFSVDLRP